MDWQFGFDVVQGLCYLWHAVNDAGCFVLAKSAGVCGLQCCDVFCTVMVYFCEDCGRYMWCKRDG